MDQQHEAEDRSRDDEDGVGRDSGRYARAEARECSERVGDEDTLRLFGEIAYEVDRRPGLVVGGRIGLHIAPSLGGDAGFGFGEVVFNDPRQVALEEEGFVVPDVTVETPRDFGEAGRVPDVVP